MELIRLLIHLPRLIKLASDFVRGTRDLAQSGDLSLEELSEEEFDWLRSCVRSILRICITCVLIFGVALPLTVPWFVWMLQHIKIEDATERMFCGMIFMVFLIPASMFLGASLGCLCAPTDFLLSPLGRKWLQFVGTQNVSGARVISFLAAASLTLFFAGYCWVISTMHPR